jgi:hypothetical protein
MLLRLSERNNFGSFTNKSLTQQLMDGKKCLSPRRLKKTLLQPCIWNQWRKEATLRWFIRSCSWKTSVSNNGKMLCVTSRNFTVITLKSRNSRLSSATKTKPIKPSTWDPKHQWCLREMPLLKWKPPKWTTIKLFTCLPPSIKTSIQLRRSTLECVSTIVL